MRDNWVVNVESGSAIVDIGFGCQKEFIEHILACLEAGFKDGEKGNESLNRVKSHLRRCLTNQHVYMIFSDDAIKVQGYQKDILQNVIDEIDMELKEF